MITKIKGQLLNVGEDSLTLEFGAYEYQIAIPEFARRQLQSQLDAEISLHTVHYLEGNPMQGKLTPRLIGFLNEAEREFFRPLLFCRWGRCKKGAASDGATGPRGCHRDRRAGRQESLRSSGNRTGNG